MNGTRIYSSSQLFGYGSYVDGDPVLEQEVEVSDGKEEEYFNVRVEVHHGRPQGNSEGSVKFEVSLLRGISSHVIPLRLEPYSHRVLNLGRQQTPFVVQVKASSDAGNLNEGEVHAVLFADPVD